ncbi:MAG: hypothetical protein ACKVU4_07820 [Phycisphaerales bacterium]
MDAALFSVLTPTLASFDENIVGLVAVAGGLGVAFVWVLAATADSMHKTRQRERTKRELAAYVAEGSMTPEDAERIIAAGRSKGKNGAMGA